MARALTPSFLAQPLRNVIYALARGHKRHVPYRNSTLTRLLQDCLGDNGKTNFIVSSFLKLSHDCATGREKNKNKNSNNNKENKTKTGIFQKRAERNI